MNTGPKLKNNNLVYGYDTGYDANGESLSRQRHYKGPSYFNILETHNNSQSSTTTDYSFVYGEEEVKIPKIGKVVSKYCDYNNNRYAADGSVNSGTSCCPNLFYYHNGHIDAEADTNYTYSIVYKHSLNYTHANFMYRYEYTSGGVYIKEGGLHSTLDTRRTHLGNGWYHAWGSFTTSSTTARLYAYSFLYNYELQTDRFYVAKIALVKNQTGQTHFVIPPHQLLAPGSSSIADTGSIIDLKKTTDIDVSNLSFDSTGQPEFDGTDDILNTGLFSGRNPSTDVFTIEAIVKSDTTSGNHMWVDATSNGSNQRLYCAHASTGSSTPMGIQNSGWSHSIPQDTDYHHYVITMNGSTAELWNNGTAHSNKGYTSYTLAGQINVGGRSGYRWVGKIPVFKIYDTVLTETEIKNNFNAYKNRFDL